jgi:hypothetical protein
MMNLVESHEAARCAGFGDYLSNAATCSDFATKAAFWGLKAEITGQTWVAWAHALPALFASRKKRPRPEAARRSTLGLSV